MGRFGQNNRPHSTNSKKAAKGVQDGPRIDAAAPPPPPTNGRQTPRTTVLGSFPRRQAIAIDSDTGAHDGLPMMRYRKLYRTNFIKVIGRLAVWFYAAAYFVGGTFIDKLSKRDSEKRRAVRLRRTFEKIGGTFIKLGQQLSIRVDLLPYAYSLELSKLLDKIDPFPTEQAIAAIERVTGGPLRETFEVFDPTPIGSASIACVYQALLKNGEMVAVKVRRPGIGEMFETDFKALDWFLNVVEFFAFIRPGFTRNPRAELYDTLMEEIDFYKEARYQALFLRESKKARETFFSAPKPYFKFSGEDVIVQEFVSGFWLSELLAAVEYNDQSALATFRQRNIDPKIVARRLLWVSYWGLWENLFFHADPHPANILIQPNNKLLFIDFGSSGSFSRSRRLAMHTINNLETKDDIEGVARVALTFMEPLPPIDINVVLKEIEAEFLNSLAGMRTPESQWWEKTSAQLWLGFFKVSNKNQIPISMGTVRMIRATLLYDTLALRLDHDIDIRKEYAKYRKGVGKATKKRMHKVAKKRLNKGLDNMDYLRLQETIDIGSRILYRSHRLLDTFSFNSLAMLSKPIVVLFEGFMLIMYTVLVIILSAITFTAYQFLLHGAAINFVEALREIASRWWFQLFILIIIFSKVRRMYLRLKDKD